MSIYITHWAFIICKVPCEESYKHSLKMRHCFKMGSSCVERLNYSLYAGRTQQNCKSHPDLRVAPRLKTWRKQNHDGSTERSDARTEKGRRNAIIPHPGNNHRGLARRFWPSAEASKERWTGPTALESGRWLLTFPKVTRGPELAMFPHMVPGWGGGSGGWFTP